MSMSLPIGPDVTDPSPTVPPGSGSLEGETVCLRPVVPVDDLEALYTASHGDSATEALWTYMPYGPFAARDAMGRWLEECARAADPAFRVVVDRASGTPVGMVSYLNIVPAHRRLELGHIWYSPRVQRTRTNTEAMYLMLREGLDRLGYRRIEWKCDALNARSRAAALRLGFAFEGVFRQHMIVKGRNRDTAWFALVDRDWPTVRANMERWLYGDGPQTSLAALNEPVVRAGTGS